MYFFFDAQSNPFPINPILEKHKYLSRTIQNGVKSIYTQNNFENGNCKQTFVNKLCNRLSCYKISNGD